MNRLLSVLSGLAIVAATSTAQAQIDWATGAPGGTPVGSIEVTPVDGGRVLSLDTGIPAASVGGDRGNLGADPPVPSTASDYTVTAWINSNEDNGFGEANDNFWWLGTGNQGLHLGIFDTSKARVGHWGADNSGTSVILANTWTHVGYSFDADAGAIDVDGNQLGQVKIYVNGVLETTVDALAPNNSSENLILGARNGGVDQWSGLIDDVAVFTSVLSDAEVGTLATTTADPVGLGAAAYYDFEDSQAGTTAANAGALGTDLSGIDGIAPPLPDVANWAVGAPGGSSGGSLAFDGANSSFAVTGIPAAQVGGNRTDGGTDYTVSAWINSTEDDGAGNAQRNRWWLGTGLQGLHVGIFNPNNTTPVSTFRSGHWSADNSGSTTVPVNTWVHATFVYDASGGSQGTGEIKIYRDGVLETTNDAIAPNQSGTDLIIGSRSGGRDSWNGMIDDVAIFTTPLSDAEVATLAGDATQAIALGAAAYYDFEDDQTGTTAANAGTLGITLDRIGPATGVLLGDVNLDGTVDFLDISPFIGVLSGSTFQAEADCDESGVVDFLDISPFIAILSAP